MSFINLALRDGILQTSANLKGSNPRQVKIFRLVTVKSSLNTFHTDMKVDLLYI